MGFRLHPHHPCKDSAVRSSEAAAVRTKEWESFLIDSIFSDFVTCFISADKATHPLDTYFYLHLYFYFFLEYPITLTKYDETTMPKAKIAINIGFLTKF